MKKGWHIKRIGEVCDLMTGGTPPRSKAEYFGGDIKWLVSGDIHQGEIFDCEGRITEAGMQASNAKQLPVNSVMIALNGQGKTRGTVALLRTQATCNQSLVSIHPKDPGELLPEFLYANLHGRYQEIRQMTGDSGNDRRGLNMGLIRQMEIPLAPVDEQQRIVGIFDNAFEGIATTKANAEKNLQNARVLFESILDVAIQGKVSPQKSQGASVGELIGQIERARDVAVSQGRAKPRQAEPFETKHHDQIKLPNGWRWTQLESLTTGISDGVHKKPHYRPDGVPFITVKNLTAGPGISFDDLNYIARKDHEEFIKRTHPEKGDILITKDGTIGVVRLIDTDAEFSIFVSVALIKPVMRELGPYLAYALRASCVQNQMVPQGGVETPLSRRFAKAGNTFAAVVRAKTHCRCTRFSTS